MNTLVIYDSAFGNTKKVAEAISDALPGNVETLKIDDANMAEIGRYDLVVIGSPTQGGRPTKEMSEFIEEMPSGLIKGVRLSAFDTRILKEEQNFGLRMVMGIIGYAAPKIASRLEKKGGKVVGMEGFIVDGKEGPLREGELERARNWSRAVANSI